MLHKVKVVLEVEDNVDHILLQRALWKIPEVTFVTKLEHLKKVKQDG